MTTDAPTPAPFPATVSHDFAYRTDRLILDVPHATGEVVVAGTEVLVLPGGKLLDLQENPDPAPSSPGVLVVPSAVWDALTDEGRAGLLDAGPTVHVEDRPFAGTPPAWLDVKGVEPPPPVPWADIAWTIGRVVLVAVLMVLAAWAGYTVGLRDHREERRTRTAVCQVLDQLGADPSTAAQAYPCRDTPAPGPGGS